MRRRMMYASQLPSQQSWRLVATLLLPLWFVSACDAQTNDKKESVAPADPATQTAASLPKEQSMSDNNQQVPATASNANAELQQRFAEIKALTFKTIRFAKFNKAFPRSGLRQTSARLNQVNISAG